jgi:hypothetical protein
VSASSTVALSTENRRMAGATVRPLSAVRGGRGKERSVMLICYGGKEGDVQKSFLCLYRIS